MQTHLISDSQPQVERHPFAPFVPYDAKALIMGTFPPKSTRWSMEFYYPNRINDFWRIMGIVFFDNRDIFVSSDGKSFLLDDIKQFLNEKGIALSDTGAAVRRLKDNASDKFLEIVEPVDLISLLERMPQCEYIATTGEKAAGVISEITATEPPKMGEYVTADYAGRRIVITRLPSTSRAYPLSIAKKAEYYRNFFIHSKCLTL